MERAYARVHPDSDRAQGLIENERGLVRELTGAGRLSERAALAIEYDNPFWPQCDDLIWPHPGVC